MIIVITGTPGTGKTTVARALALRIGAELIEIKKIVDSNPLLFPKQNSERIVDIKKLEKLVAKEIKKNKLSARYKKNKIKSERELIIVEGHLASELKLPAHLVFVLRCHPRTLNKRLQKRRYRKEKIKENLLAELLDYCTQKAQEKNEATPIEIETAARTPQATVKKIIDILNGKAQKGDHINYSAELKKFLGLYDGTK